MVKTVTGVTGIRLRLTWISLRLTVKAVTGSMLVKMTTLSTKKDMGIRLRLTLITRQTVKMVTRIILWLTAIICNNLKVLGFKTINETVMGIRVGLMLTVTGSIKM